MGIFDKLFRKKKEEELKFEVIDFRSPEERREEEEMEEEARSGVSLGPEVDRLVGELIETGRSEGFLTMPPREGTCGNCGGKVVKKGRMVKCTYCGREQNLDHFDKSYRHVRAREIGARLNEMGGKKLMRAVYYQVDSATGAGPQLSHAWAYIGNWLP